MDIDRLRKLSGLNEKRPGDRGFTPGVQVPPDRLKNDRGFTPGEPEPGYEPGNRGFIPGAPQVPPMPTPKPGKPSPKPKSPPRPTPPSRPNRPEIPSPAPAPVPSRPDRPDRPPFEPKIPSRKKPFDAELIHMPPPDWDGWDKYRDPRSYPKKTPEPALPSLREYLKMVRR